MANARGRGKFCEWIIRYDSRVLSWNFGNGQTSTGTNPTSVYGHGDYLVTLTTAINGCQSSLTKNLKIYSKPQPDFSIGLPPLSCAGTPSRWPTLLPDLWTATSLPELAIWRCVNNTSQQRNPAFTYASAGNYIVSLQATSDAGCEFSAEDNRNFRFPERHLPTHLLV